MSVAPSLLATAVVLALASHSGLAGAISPMQPGLWELRVGTVVAGQPVPASKARECISQKDIDHETRTLPRPEGDCTLSDIVTEGDRTSYGLVCKTGNTTGRGRMDLTVGKDSYDGKTDMLFSGVGSDDIPITIVIHASRIGDCSK